MFEDSLFATNRRSSPQRGVVAGLSFGVQAVFLGLLVLVPLLYTDALPLGSLKTYVEIPLPPGPPPQPSPSNPVRRPPQQQTSEMRDGILLPPNRIPDHIADISESAVPPPPGPYVSDSTGGTGAGSPLMNTLLASNMRAAAPPPNVTTPRTVRLSTGVSEGLLIRKITPIYPKIAIIAHQQGSVQLQAQIGRDGTIQNLRVLSGPPLLVGAALEAVKQWRYRPYLLNNEPVEVETQITVNFTLGG